MFKTLTKRKKIKLYFYLSQLSKISLNYFYRHKSSLKIIFQLQKLVVYPLRNYQQIKKFKTQFKEKNRKFRFLRVSRKDLIAKIFLLSINGSETAIFYKSFCWDINRAKLKRIEMIKIKVASENCFMT